MRFIQLRQPEKTVEASVLRKGVVNDEAWGRWVRMFRSEGYGIGAAEVNAV